MPNIAYVNGRWGHLASASVSVEDRGFQFGDGVYELIRTYHGTVFHLQEHIKRLYESLKQIEISIKETPLRLEQIVQSGVKKSGHSETKIYIQVTRGAAPRLHSFPKGVRPTLVMTFRKLDPLSPKIFNKGVAIISVEDIRWGLCNVKSL
ncbi:MAG: aminotransferase class IV, partial [Nitrospirae bacterium]|nr:aminotransferase class IV [Candidatus Troglogloeales bacterium]